MDANSDMKLILYKVNKLYFELNNNFKLSGHESIRINPDFNRKVDRINKDEYTIYLNVKICKEAHDKIIPFFAEVNIAGRFKFNDWEKDNRKLIALNNATAILFPYIRSLLSTLTTTGNLPPYYLPIMNVNRLFSLE